MESISKAGSAEALRRIQSFWLANLVHDLRNSLFVARGYTRMVLEDREDSLADIHRRYLSVAVQHIGRIFGLVGELDDFPSQLELHLNPVSLRALLQHEVSELTAGGRNKDVHFIAQIANNPLQIMGDSAKLASAMQGLLTAAVDFTGPKGTVCIEAINAGEKIALRLSATNGASNLQPDISTATKILRIHGGTVSVKVTPDSGLVLHCDLPVA